MRWETLSFCVSSFSDGEGFSHQLRLLVVPKNLNASTPLLYSHIIDSKISVGERISGSLKTITNVLLFNVEGGLQTFLSQFQHEGEGGGVVIGAA